MKARQLSQKHDSCYENTTVAMETRVRLPQLGVGRGYCRHSQARI